MSHQELIGTPVEFLCLARSTKMYRSAPESAGVPFLAPPWIHETVDTEDPNGSSQVCASRIGGTDPSRPV